MEGRKFLIAFLKKLLSTKVENKEPQLRPDYWTYDFNTGVWGHHFEYWEKPTGEGTPRELKVWGHYTPRPQNGDLVKMAMKSGRTVLWVVTDCEYPGDPHDMFYCTLYGLGYQDEYALPESTNKMLKSEWIL